MKRSVHSVTQFLPVIALVCLAISCAITQSGVSENQPKPTDITTRVPASQTATLPEETLTPTTNPMATLAGVCQGIPEPEAAEYPAKNVPHRVYFISNSAEGPDWNSQVPQDWLADTVSEAVLTGCLEERETIIETCTYLVNGFADRYQYDTTIQLVAAKSGEVIYAFTHPGAAPEKCPSTMTFDRLSPKRASIFGGHVTFTEVAGILGLYIESPTPTRVVQSEVELGKLALSTDRALLASVSYTGTISLWDTNTVKILNTY